MLQRIWNRSTRRTKRRGVSPIIATILLVAITVVLAAVLYVLISGLTHTGASTPYTLGMSAPVESSSGTTYYYAITISPQTGLTSAMFGVSLKTATGNAIAAVGTVPAACKGPSGGTAGAAFSTTCTTATGTGASWYAVLYWLGNGSVANVFSSTGSWSAPTLSVQNSEQLVVVSASNLAGSSDTLNAYSTGASSVSGQSGAF